MTENVHGEMTLNIVSLSASSVFIPVCVVVVRVLWWVLFSMRVKPLRAAKAIKKLAKTSTHANQCDSREGCRATVISRRFEELDSYLHFYVRSPPVKKKYC